MKALLESSIRWNRVENKPGDSFRYHIKKATMEQETSTLHLEVCLNFTIPAEDLQRIEMVIREEFPAVENLRLQCTYAQELPKEAEVLRLIQPAKKEKAQAILGKAITGEAVSLKSVSEEGNPVIVTGQIFRKDVRILQNKKIMVTLLITDQTTSICVKWFTTQEKWEEADERIKEGDWIKVRGAVQFDTYESALVLHAKDIQSVCLEVQTDLAPDKRVELHAHTKMSAMDGLNDVGELLSTVAKWGHKAIAITDHGVVQAFPDAAKYIKNKKLNLKLILGLEGYLLDDSGQEKEEEIDYRSGHTNHIILLAKNQTGLKNLYKLVSLSHLEYFYRRPRIPRSVLSAHREGLIIGSACEAGEIYQALLEGKTDEQMRERVAFYDYLEIQPLINNRFLIENGRVADWEGLRDLNRRIVKLGEACGKPVVATCDTHYTKEDEGLYRRILMAGQGYKDAESGEGLFLRTTEEMLAEFSYLGEETARKVVVDNTISISEAIEHVMPVPEGRFPPVIENSDTMLREMCFSEARKIYGDVLPAIVEERLERELSSIIGNGYAVMYVSAQMLVHRSLADGYLVGSRGSVGSSLAATMAGITEVNPLQPHYLCENRECRHSEFPENPDSDCGVDLPDKDCPICGRRYKKDGFNIPFEVFLGFDGDKEPDIDLNFAGEYQATAHKYLEEIFGSENVFRAGTIGTVAGKTAYGFVRKYFEERNLPVNKWEVERLTQCCTGVRRTTGQHPGGIIILPRGLDISDFCPVQHPANDMGTDIVTTHFDYHSIDENLLKLDILGHDVPSMIRMLQDMTGVDPLSIPLQDPAVNGIFNGIEGLSVREEDYPFTHGTYGIPEFGTKFVRQMLDDIKPTRFSDLVRISGFSHGTDVWINNAQNLIRSGTATIKEAISTRDDIMNDLIAKGVPKKSAFKIMENVRKGKGVTEEEAELLRKNNVPEWYIESCRRIQYMFPKAHAVAYVMMSYRIAYYKVYHPSAFYAALFTMKIADFNEQVILGGLHTIKRRMADIEEKGKNATKKEEEELSVLESAFEMLARGYEFLPVDLFASDAVKFRVKGGKVLLPFSALSGVGENASRSIVEEREKSSFYSIEEIRNRAKLNKTAVQALMQSGALAGLPESDQLTLF